MNKSEKLFIPPYENLTLRDKISFNLSFLRNIPQKKIAIDGGVSRGKTTLVSRLAKDLEMEVVKTGNIYRAITWLLLESKLTVDKIISFDDSVLEKILSSYQIKFNKEDSTYWVSDSKTKIGVSLQDQILRSDEITGVIPAISAKNPIRDIVDANSNKVLSKNNNVLYDGRDNYQVFENSDEDLILIYLYASKEDLIQREIGRQKKLGKDISREEVWLVICDRDNADHSKDRGKFLFPAEVLNGLGNYDLIIDSSGLKIEETYLLVLESIVSLIKVKKDMEEMESLWNSFTISLENISDEFLEENKELLMFLAKQREVIDSLYILFKKAGNKFFANELLIKLDNYINDLRYSISCF